MIMRNAAFTVPASGWNVYQTSGSQAITLGFAQLGCTSEVDVQAFSSAFSVTGAKLSDAIVGASLPKSSTRLIHDGRQGNRLALAIANTADTPVDYIVSARLLAGEPIVSGVRTLSSSAVYVGYVDELIRLPENNVSQVTIETLNSGRTVSVSALRFSGSVFSTVLPVR
jgi:hypothetical protein